MPPSTSSRSLISTGLYTIGSAVDARTAEEMGTSSQPSAPNTIRSQVSRSVALRYSSFSRSRKSSLRSGSDRTART
jgi:hypothetical protein